MTKMKFRLIAYALLITLLLRVLYLLFYPLDTDGIYVSDCFQEGCAVFEGDRISLSGDSYAHQVFTDELPPPDRVPYSEYSGNVDLFGNVVVFHKSYLDHTIYFLVSDGHRKALLPGSWWLIYLVSGYQPAYRIVNTEGNL